MSARILSYCFALSIAPTFLTGMVRMRLLSRVLIAIQRVQLGVSHLSMGQATNSGSRSFSSSSYCTLSGSSGVDVGQDQIVNF